MKNKLIINLLITIILMFVIKGILILQSIHPDVLDTYKCVQSLEAYLYITGVLIISIGLSFNISTFVEKETDLTK